MRQTALEADRLPRGDFDTPLLTVNLEAVERNISRMQAYCDEHGFAFRPHIKTHKIPAIAQLQVQAGAVGITCQKLGEAEVMAAAGLDNILVAFPLIGEKKGERLAALAQTVTTTVAADSEAVLRGLSNVLGRESLEIGVLVECDTGYGRTGVQTPAHAAELAELAVSLPGLRFAGLMTYPTLPESGRWLRAAREEVEWRGIAVECVSGGGTQSAFRTHEVGEITEIRAGTYVYGDRSCLALGVTALEDCAVRVLATVVSRPTDDRAILDAGSKGFTNDVAKGGITGFGLIVEYPDARIYALSEEHAHVDVGPCGQKPQVGEIVTIVPNHACGITNLFDEVLVHRDGLPMEKWRVAARGRLC